MNIKFCKTSSLRLFLATFFIACASIAKAQENVEMADTMRSNGKIYVVVAVCLIILVGLFLYVMNVDRKLRKLERESKGQ